MSSSVVPANSHSWEAQKENAAPLERGRNVSSLGIRQFGRDRDDLKDKVRHYEDLIAPSENPDVNEMKDDPLQHWLSYIKFYQDSFPADTRDNFLIIERCVRALVKMKQYRNDDRFVSVCAKYADKTKDPGQVFKYLHQQKVGAQTALFWIAWAFVAEKNNDFPFAEQIFKKGISKGAEPLQMIKLRHQQFQRRMSRHWLNSSKSNESVNDEYETGEQGRASRSTLGGISRDGLRRNDRSQRRIPHRTTHNPLGRRENSSGRSKSGNQNENRSNKKGSFHIFVEEEGENAYNLDQELSHDRATIARDSDRRKENSLAAERWNERGGIQPSYRRSNPSNPRSKGPMPAFSVFVDDECAAEHERQEKEQEQQLDRHRNVRDERTFRERDGEALAEKLLRDPVRYMKEPNRLKTESLVGNKHREATKVEKEKPERKSRAGFDKRLLKNRKGEEQCFEEARAIVGAYALMLGASHNFNLLADEVKADQSSHLDLDNASESMDTSMSDSTSKADGRNVFEPNGERKRLFETVESSFDAGLDQTAISHASSTVNEINVVGTGLRGKHAEETINTKFAMRELSMMFSSPAFGVDEERKRLDRSHTSKIDELATYECKADESFGNVGDGIMLDNSICNSGKDEASMSFVGKVNNGSNKGFSIFCDDQASAEKSCGNRNEEKLHTNAPQMGAFQIYNDAVGEEKKNDITKAPQAGAFEIYEEGKTSFSGDIGNAGGSTRSNVGFKIFNDEDETENKLENGDTASISDAMALMEDKVEAGESSYLNSSDDGDTSGVDGNDTADLSLINEIFQNDSGFRGGRNRDRFCNEKVTRNSRTCLQHSKMTTSKKRTKKSKELTMDFRGYANYSISTSLDYLQNNSELVDPNATLLSLLMCKEKAFHLPTAMLPKQLRRKQIISNAKVSVGAHSGLVLKTELGRGTYGRVILLKKTDREQINNVAIKVQSPTGSLGWEYVILRRMEQRLSSKGKRGIEYPYPRPISFVSLVDGGILSMSAASKTGFNLVDLSNFYKLKVGEPVPEILALHYTSIMLKIIEALHCHAKILHCDVKPDNFVLSTPSSSNHLCSQTEWSTLTLVDFGNAVDLQLCAEYTGENAENVMLCGDAAKKDMQCVSMREGRPWSYDSDYFGILCCAHVLLHGTHLEIRKGKENVYAPSTRFKRYWNRDLWKEIFESLLIFDRGSDLLLSNALLKLRKLRSKVDSHLLQEGDKLSRLLRRQVAMLPDSRSKLC